MQAAQDTIRRPDSRQGSYAQNYWEITSIHERMAKHGLDFAMNLHEMSDDLQELAANAERQRKQWKQTGLAAETRARDSVGAMQKAKEKSYSLADQYDRARTGEKVGGRFGLKKGGSNQEDDLLRKAQGADQEYAQRVQTAQSQRTELLNMHRPQALKALQDLIAECDSGVTMQMQKFAALNERLLLSNGLCVNPLSTEANGAGPKVKSMREVAQSINHTRDLHQHVLENQTPMDARTPELRYEKHHALASPKQPQQPYASQQNFNSSQPQFGYPSQPNQGLGVGYDHGPRPGPPGQVTGVTTYPNRDGQPPNQYGPYGQQPSGPPQGQQYGVAPSLPPLNLMSGGAGALDQHQGFQPDGRRPDGMPTGEQRTVSSPLTMHRPQASDVTRPSEPRQEFGDMQQRSASGPGMGSGIVPGVGPGPTSGPAPPRNTSERNDYGPPVGSPYRSEGQQPQSQGSPMGMPYRQDSSQPPTGPQTGFQDPRGAPPTGPPASFPQGQRGPPPQGFPPQGGPNGAFGGPQHAPSGSVSSLNKPTTTATPLRTRNETRPSLPPNNPVFGVSLDELFRRDGSAVPTIVYQCVQAVDLFGLNVEGIYRTSGSAPHIMEMKALFDHGTFSPPFPPTTSPKPQTNKSSDSSQVDFRHPAAFHNDIASVTTLLKHFLRDLPDPLLTSANYAAFIQASKIEDDIVRRDSLHAIINSLPDPNYASLRVIALHLTRVARSSERNRMTPSNLAICFGPTLMGGGQQGNGGGVGGAGQGGDIRDAGWQARVVETILVNTMQIFDDDE